MKQWFSDIGQQAVKFRDTREVENKQAKYFFKIFIVIQLQLSAFSPHPSMQPQLNPPPSPTSKLSFNNCPSIVP